MEEQGDVASVFRVIFCSCDVDNTDLVPVSKLIEFVQPYMIEDLNALEDLRQSLDPEGKNILVNSERFYEVMEDWSKKIASSFNDETEFNRSPSRLAEIDDKELPYVHSTPRASIGDKLLKCKDLLNVSNVSGYSLSTSRLESTNPADSDKTVLEEEIKKLEHQLAKTTMELTITKQQLTASEEQNETFQQDLDRLNRRLHAEQQVNEHLHKEKNINEDLREELNYCKKMIEEQKKKLSQSEKDSIHYRDVIDELDQEKLKLEKKLEVLSQQHQECLKENFDIKTEFETKEQELADVVKVYNELKVRLAEQKDVNDQLREENEILNHQKSTLDKALKLRSRSPRCSLGNLSLELTNTPSPHHNTHDTNNFLQQNEEQSKSQSKPLIRRVLARNSTPISLANSLLDSSMPDSVKSLPVLSPLVHGVRQEDDEQRQDSSEEDLYANIEGQDGESLQTEMHRADPLISETYHTALFEKDEQIVELEEELEKIKIYLKECEDQKNEFLTKLKEQIKVNEELMQNNLVLLSKEGTTQTKIESLKTRLTQVERNGVIAENDHEISEAEIEELQSEIQRLKELVQNRDIEIQEFKRKIESTVLLEKNIAKLKEQLDNKESLIADYNEKLQTVMRDLDQISEDKVSLEDKLYKVEELNKRICDKNKLLEEHILALQHDQESSISKYECLKKVVNELEEKLKLKEEELKQLINAQKQTDEELVLFKENLEKKIVGEFEGKVKYSMEAEEKILNLTKESEQLEEDLKNTLSELSTKSRHLVEAENKIKSLKNIETSLKKEIEDLKEKDAVIAELKKLNKIAEYRLNQAQLDLSQKVEEILKLRNEWIKGIEVKNDLWGKLKILEKENYKIDTENKELLTIHQQLVDSNETLKIERNDLLTRYDLEVNKNSKLNEDISQLMEEKKICCNKYDELKIEFDTITSKLGVEVQENQKLNHLLAESRARLHDLEVQNKELQEKSSQVQKNDSVSQTEAIENDAFEEEFSKIKIESDKLLEELESRLNEEMNKNRNLNEDLLELKRHLDQSNTELLNMKQKITNNEADMFAKLQQNIENNKKLAEELSQTKEILRIKEIELSKAIDTEEKVQTLTKINITLNQELTSKCKELEKMKQRKMDNYEKILKEVEAKNMELLQKLTDVESLLKQKQMEMGYIKGHNQQLMTELDMTKNEKDTLNNELLNATSKIVILQQMLSNNEKEKNFLHEQGLREINHIENKNESLLKELEVTKEEKEKLSERNNEQRLLLEEQEMEMTRIKNINGKLQFEFNMTKQEKEKLNREHQNTVTEIIKLKEKLKEEISKNKAIFEKFTLLKKERDQLILDLNESKCELSEAKTLYNKKQVEFKDLKTKYSELEKKNQIQTEQLKKSDVLLQQNNDELIKLNLEKNLVNTELAQIKLSVGQIKSEFKSMEMELSETKNALDRTRINNKKLTVAWEETKRKLSESLSSDSSTRSEQEISKSRTYSRQQITIEKLRDKLEDMENRLTLEKNKNQELQNQLSLSESKIICNEERYKKEIAKVLEKLIIKEETKKTDTGCLKRTRSVPSFINNVQETCEGAEGIRIKCEGKTVNKFTLASRPVSPDSPSLDIELTGFDSCKKLSFYNKCPFSNNCDSINEVPSLDLKSFADDIIEELELTDGSPRKKLDKDEMEKNVTTLTLKLLASSKSISEKIERQTGKYRYQYEEILNLVRDISHRLRDHVCIGTAEPIMPVFVLLENIKQQLNEIVQTAGQVGVLIYEDRMKKCWNLVTNYMAVLRQENESLHNTARETTPTQTGVVRRRNKFTQDKDDLTVQTSHRRRRLLSCTRLTATLVFVLVFALTASIIVHLNCRLTSSESQYCPLDGIITRVNVGIPPM